jgi:hypothetical protein
MKLSIILAILSFCVLMTICVLPSLINIPTIKNANKNKQKEEKFTNVYRYWSKKLKEFNQNPMDLGKPGGILKYTADKNLCDSFNYNQNLIPQSKMTFRPVHRSNGCTYLDLQYPQ